MMRCDQVRAQLEDHLDGRIAARDAAAVAEHLASCAECRARHNELAALAAAARALPREIDPAEDLWPGIVSRLPGRRHPRAGWLRENGWQVSSIGLLAAATVAGVLLMRDASPPAPSGREPAVTTPVAVVPIPAATTLDATYREVRAGLALALAARCQELPSATCEEVKVSLQVLDDSAAELGHALRTGGGRPQETLLLTNDYEMMIDRARGLTSRLTRI